MNKNERYLPWCEDESGISAAISPTSRHFVGGGDKYRYAVCDALTGNVSDQVCEAEKDEDGHALNLKGENYTTHTGPLPPLLYEPDYLPRVIKIYICTLCY